MERICPCILISSIGLDMRVAILLMTRMTTKVQLHQLTKMMRQVAILVWKTKRMMTTR